MTDEQTQETFEAPEEGAFSLTPTSLMPWAEEGDEETGKEQADDTQEEDEEGEDDSTIRLGEEDVSRETLAQAWTDFKSAQEDDDLKPYLTGDDPASLLDLARAGARITGVLARQAEDPKASLELVGDVLAKHFAAHGDADEAEEEAVDLLYQIEHPETLDPAARPFYEAARAAVMIGRRQYEITQGLAQELQAAHEKIAELEQGPELLERLRAKVPGAEISAAELRSWMKKIGTESPAVAYRAYEADAEERKSPKGKGRADAKTTPPNQPKTRGTETYDPAKMEPSEIFRAMRKGQTAVTRQ